MASLILQVTLTDEDRRCSVGATRDGLDVDILTNRIKSCGFPDVVPDPIDGTVLVRLGEMDRSRFDEAARTLSACVDGRY